MLWTAALAAPVVYAIVSAPPLTGTVQAQAPMRMVGPNFPVRVDASGDSSPGGGDESITTTRVGNTITVNSRWSACDPGNPNNQVQLSNQIGGRFHTLTRQNGNLTQSLTVQTSSGAAASSFSYEQTSLLGGAPRTGSMSLVDQNSDGITDLLMIGGAVTASVGFTFYGSGNEYVSIPWSQASSLGVRDDTCGGAAQIFIPLADTNGDGSGDTVVPDLDGNGVPDGEFFSGPPVAAPAVPSLGAIARAILLTLLGLYGAWRLSTDARSRQAAQ